MASFFKIQVINDDNDEDLGLVRLTNDKGEPTIAEVCEQIEGDEIVTGCFDFIEENYILKKRQEERWTLSNKIQVRIKRSVEITQETTSLNKRRCLGSVEGKHAAYNCLANFTRTHILESNRHEKNYLAFCGLRKDATQGVPAGQQQDDKEKIEAAIEKLNSLMTVNEDWDFEIVTATLHNFKDKSFVRLRCKYDDTWLRLCPPESNLSTLLTEHTKSILHTKALMKEQQKVSPTLTGLRGRPQKNKEHDPKQTSLSKFVVSTKLGSSNQGDASFSSGNHAESESSALSLKLLCWGLWIHDIKVNSKSVSLKPLLDDQCGGPSHSTTKRGHGLATQFLPGIQGHMFDAIAEIYQKEKEKHGIMSLVPFTVVEDETVIKKRIRWNPKDDTLIGFDGHKVEDHECGTSNLIKVVVGKAGYEMIIKSFENHVIGGYARVFVANPLHEALSRLVLVAHSTCNGFDAHFVHKQWAEISSLWNEKLKPTIGPIIGHASNGDSRQRALMLADYVHKNDTRFQIKWNGWPLSAKMKDGDVLGMHDQDFVHNGKKLVNVLDKPKHKLALGDVWITLNHVTIVYDSFPVDKHMQEVDIKREDCINWPAAQRICSRQVQQCLGELANSGQHRQERSMIGTRAYLEIDVDYIDIFLSPHLNLGERVHLAAKVAFFFQIWRSWIQHHPKYTLSTNIISKETFLDVQVSCHFVVLLIKYFRDFHSNFRCPLHLTGSNVAEIFFSKVGSMVG
ncbi:hypothetical protein L7F22_047964 [Adiantum nelumboides]|nr:hypothetical protein [Adiantum nelumboides]